MAQQTAMMGRPMMSPFGVGGMPMPGVGMVVGGMAGGLPTGMPGMAQGPAMAGSSPAPGLRPTTLPTNTLSPGCLCARSPSRIAWAECDQGSDLCFALKAGSNIPRIPGGCECHFCACASSPSPSALYRHDGHDVLHGQRPCDGQAARSRAAYGRLGYGQEVGCARRRRPPGPPRPRLRLRLPLPLAPTTHHPLCRPCPQHTGRRD